MKSFGATLAFAGAASAAAIQSRQAPAAQCCFGINVNGAVSGSVGLLADGQNRVGAGFSGAQFCYYPSTTSIVDESGRGCISTAPTGQYQCDAGLTATTATSGITLASNGSIEHNGSAVWYECNSGSGYNLYTMLPAANAATGCSPITLDVSGGNCTLGASSSSAGASTSILTSTILSTSTKPASTTTASVVSQTTATVASPTTATVATPTTATVVAPTTLISATTAVSVSTSVSVQSCVPSTVTSTFTAPAPPAVTVTAPAPPAATITAPAPPAVTVTAPAPPAVTVTAPAPPAATVTAPAPPAVTVTAPCTSAPVASAPVASAPASSAPAASAPVASAPAPSAPAASAPAPSAPAASAPAPSAPVASAPGASATSAPGASSSTSTKTLQSTLTLTQSAAVSTASASGSAATAATPTAPAATACATPNSNGNYGCPSLCPLDLSTGPFQYPHLLEINGQNGYFGEVNATAKTDFTFDIPASYAGMTCDAYFALPTKDMLVTSDYWLSGAGKVYFSEGGKEVASCSPTPGNSVLVSSGPCAAGQAVSYEMTADAGVDLRWFQDYNACAIGLYVVPS